MQGYEDYSHFVHSQPVSLTLTGVAAEMRLPLYCMLLLYGWALAAPTTVWPTKTAGTTCGKQCTNTAKSSSVYTSSATRTTPSTTRMSSTTGASTKKPSLLRDEISFPSLHRLKGRVVLANTRMEGSNEWGVNSEQAELACSRIAQQQMRPITPSEMFRALMSSILPPENNTPMEGHLLSVGSSSEVLALSHLLHPLPDGAYWTGGKLVRYRVKDPKSGRDKDKVVLTWSDGRVGRANVLGMTKADEEQLQEGYTYCLALNLRDATWQARDCSDLLPYACLITPRQIMFDNQVKISTTTPTQQRQTQTPVIQNGPATIGRVTTYPTTGYQTTKSGVPPEEDRTTTTEEPESVSPKLPNMAKVEATATATATSKPTSASTQSRTIAPSTTNVITATPNPNTISGQFTKSNPSTMTTAAFSPSPISYEYLKTPETIRTAVDDGEYEEEDDDEYTEVEPRRSSDGRSWGGKYAQEIVSSSTLRTTTGTPPVTTTTGFTGRSTRISASTTATKTATSSSTVTVVPLAARTTGPQMTTMKAKLLQDAYTGNSSPATSTGRSTPQPGMGSTTSQSSTITPTIANPTSSCSCTKTGATTKKPVVTPKLLSGDVVTKTVGKTTTAQTTTETNRNRNVTDSPVEIARAILKEHSRHRNEYRLLRKHRSM
ncbi:unnamed protein product [Calicophoron daubneyi]|uniref:C-type lectin domain-containing protein n=1 Tax=Calicophoron daubneyi TaxID=300641 RepID=A0AAV2T2Q8_CALDB